MKRMAGYLYLLGLLLRLVRALYGDLLVCPVYFNQILLHKCDSQHLVC